MATKQSLWTVFCLLVVLTASKKFYASGKTLTFIPNSGTNEVNDINSDQSLSSVGFGFNFNFWRPWSTLKNSVKHTVENFVNKFSQGVNFPVFSCPCMWPPHCSPISTNPKNEVMIFSVSNNSSHWAKYDWKKVTTVVMFDYYSADLMCLAHKHGVRAVVKVTFPLANVTNATAGDLFIKKTVDMVKTLHIDGINFDIEDPVDKSDFKRINAFTELVKKLVTALKAVNKNYKISFDAAWSPDCVDKRCYDLFEISKVVDYLFIMAYDEQSQMREKDCIARPNSGFNKTVGGVLKYIQKNIPRKNLILGLPWYGYDYPCLSLSKDDVCAIKKVPFRGVNCSDAVGSQLTYSAAHTLLSSQHLIRRWDNDSSTPFFNYKDTKGTFHQVRFDDVRSLSLKYAFAVKIGLGGVGVWNADSLNYSAPEEAVFKSMWEALPKFP